MALAVRVQADLQLWGFTFITTAPLVRLVGWMESSDAQLPSPSLGGCLFPRGAVDDKDLTLMFGKLESEVSWAWERRLRIELYDVI